MKSNKANFLGLKDKKLDVKRRRKIDPSQQDLNLRKILIDQHQQVRISHIANQLSQSVKKGFRNFINFIRSKTAEKKEESDDPDSSEESKRAASVETTTTKIETGEQLSKNTIQTPLKSEIEQKTKMDIVEKNKQSINDLKRPHEIVEPYQNIQSFQRSTKGHKLMRSDSGINHKSYEQIVQQSFKKRSQQASRQQKKERQIKMAYGNINIHIIQQSPRIKIEDIKRLFKRGDQQINISKNKNKISSFSDYKAYKYLQANRKHIYSDASNEDLVVKNDDQRAVKFKFPLQEPMTKIKQPKQQRKGILKKNKDRKGPFKVIKSSEELPRQLLNIVKNNQFYPQTNKDNKLVDQPLIKPHYKIVKPKQFIISQQQQFNKPLSPKQHFRSPQLPKQHTSTSIQPNFKSLQAPKQIQSTSKQPNEIKQARKTIQLNPKSSSQPQQKNKQPQQLNEESLKKSQLKQQQQRIEQKKKLQSQLKLRQQSRMKRLNEQKQKQKQKQKQRQKLHPQQQQKKQQLQQKPKQNPQIIQPISPIIIIQNNNNNNNNPFKTNPTKILKLSDIINSNVMHKTNQLLNSKNQDNKNNTSKFHIFSSNSNSPNIFKSNDSNFTNNNTLNPINTSSNTISNQSNNNNVYNNNQLKITSHQINQNVQPQFKIQLISADSPFALNQHQPKTPQHHHNQPQNNYFPYANGLPTPQNNPNPYNQQTQFYSNYNTQTNPISTSYQQQTSNFNISNYNNPNATLNPLNVNIYQNNQTSQSYNYTTQSQLQSNQPQQLASTSSPKYKSNNLFNLNPGMISSVNNYTNISNVVGGSLMGGKGDTNYYKKCQDPNFNLFGGVKGENDDYMAKLKAQFNQKNRKKRTQITRVQ